MAAALEVRNLTVRLGGRTILDGISGEIEQGELVAVLGANGSGKTTLLKTILGLVPAQSGEIRIAGLAAGRGNPLVGYCPQSHVFERETPLSAADLVGLGYDGRRWGFSWRDARRDRLVAEVLDEVGASAFAAAPVGQLSGGEQQRLSIAQALLAQPKLLLLDEPLSNLDIRSQQDIVNLVARLSRERGMATLFVTHGLNPLLGAMQRVWYLASGQAVLGAVDDVVTGPALSRLYGSPVEVIRAEGKIFISTADGHDHV